MSINHSCLGLPNFYTSNGLISFATRLNYHSSVFENAYDTTYFEPISSTSCFWSLSMALLHGVNAKGGLIPAAHRDCCEKKKKKF